MWEKPNKPWNKVAEYWWIVIPLILFAPWLIPIAIAWIFLLYFFKRPLFNQAVVFLWITEYMKQIKSELGITPDNTQTKVWEWDLNKNEKVDELGWVYTMKQESTQEYLERLEQEGIQKKRATEKIIEEKKYSFQDTKKTSFQKNQKSSIWDDYETVAERFKRNKK